MHRASLSRRLNIPKAAEWAGKLTNTMLRTIPGVGGAVMLSIGLEMVWRPLFFLAVGAFLIILDRRVP